MSNGRSAVVIVTTLLFYGLVGFECYRGWNRHREAAQTIVKAEQYRTAHGGALPECACDFGVDERHAFYERTTPGSYTVEYFGPSGKSFYDSGTGKWHTDYWWSVQRKNVLSPR